MLGLHLSQTSKCFGKLSNISRYREFTSVSEYQELRMLRRKVQLTFYILNIRLAEMTFS